MTGEKCLVELDEVLKYLVKEELEKIPVEIRDAISSQKDKEYEWKYDETKPLNEQNLNRGTIVMLSYLSMKYMQTKEQKALMEEYHKLNEHAKKQEQISNNDNLMSEEIKEGKEEIKTDEQLIKMEEEKWYQKLFNSIKSLLKR